MRKELEQELKKGDRGTLMSLAKLIEIYIQECRERLDTAQDKDVLMVQGEIKGHKKLLSCIKNT